MIQVSSVPLKVFSILLSTALLVACGADPSTESANESANERIDPVSVPDEPEVVVTPDPVVVQEQQVSAVFENNFQGWLDTLTGVAVTVDFESVASLSRTLINGNEFTDNAGTPEFTQLEGVGMIVGNPSDGDQIISPVSGINSFFMGCAPDCEGIVRVDFSTPINAFGAFFIDVEADFASTGFSLSDSEIPEFAFSQAQGQNAQSHLGFTSATPFSSVFIHFSTGPTSDGTAMDDMSYVLTQTAF